MGLLNRKALLQKETLAMEKVEFENGDYVFVKEMTGRARDSFERSLMKKVADKGKPSDYQSDLENFRAKLAVATMCDDNGNLLCRPDDVTELSEAMGAAHLMKIVDVAQRLNKISEEEKEDLVKNSGAVQDGNSNSDSVEH